MCCSRAYVHKNIQPYVNYVKIPAKSLYQTPSKDPKKADTKDFIRESFLLQEGIVYFSSNTATVWFSEQSFIKCFNNNFSAYHCTQPAEVDKLIQEAKKLLNKASDYLVDLENYIKDYKKTVKELKNLSQECNTYKFFCKTWLYNNKAVITDKTSKVPFVPIDRQIKNIT